MQNLTKAQILNLADRVIQSNDAQLLCANIEGKVRFANEHACNRLGYSLDDMLAKYVRDYTSGYSDTTWDGHCQRTLQKGNDRIYTLHRDCSGNQYQVEINSFPHTIQETQEQLICSIIADAQNSNRYRQMLEIVEHSQRIGSFDFDLQDQSILASDNLKAIMGIEDPEDLKLANMVDRLRHDDVSRWNSAMLGFINGEHRLDDIFMIRTVNNQYSQLRVVMWSTLRDGKVSGITGYYEILDEPTEEGIISLEESQRRHISRALAYTNGRVTGPNGAARLLDINGKTLFARMKKLGVNRDDFRRH